MNTRTLLLFALAVLQACSSSSQDHPITDNPTEDVASVEMEAVVVLAGGGSLQLFDPSTGLPSPVYEANPDTTFSSVTVSPNGTQLAYNVADGVQLAEVTIQASGPVLTTTTKWTLEELAMTRPVVRLQWSPDGERLVYDSGSIDIASGEVFSCPGFALSNGLTAGDIIAGGHDIICRGTLLRDHLPLAEGLSATSTTDGQFNGFGLHIPSGSVRDIDVFVSLGQELITPLADGEFGQFPGGVHGTYVVKESAGFVDLFRRETDTTPPVNARTFSPHETFTTGTDLMPTDWKISDALMSYFNDGEGRRYRFVGTSADGTEVIYQINSHVIDQDSLTPVLNEIPVEAALVAISRTGEVRGMRTKDLGQTFIETAFRNAQGQRATQFDVLEPLGLVDLGEGNLLLPSASTGLADPTWWLGWVDGAPWAGEKVGIISPDGRWFAGIRDINSGKPQAACFTEIKKGPTKKCIVPPTGLIRNAVNAFVYGAKRQFDGDPPRVLATSRTAAWNGSTVMIHGLRFGAMGQVSVGGTKVPASAITEWTDRRIAFTMDPSLPDNGKIEVEAATGSSAGGRTFWIHRTALATTPFDTVPIDRIALGQGLNIVDLGELTGFDDIVGNAGPLRLTADLRLEDGRYGILSEGASEPIDGATKLVVGEYSRALFYRLENRLVSKDGWAFASRLQGFTPGQPSSFVHIAGDLIVMGLGGQHPYVDGERLAFMNPADRIPNTGAAYRGIPNFWRNIPGNGGAWVFIKFNNYQYELRKQTGWDGPLEYGPVHAPAPRLVLTGMTGVEAIDDVVLVTGFGGTGAGYALSTDGGLSFDQSVSVGSLETRFREPIRVDTTVPFFLVMESPLNSPGLSGIRDISINGTVGTLTSVPPGQLDGGLILSPRPVQHAVRGGEVVIYFPMTKTLVRADFDANLTGAPWDVLPSPAHAGKVESFYSEQGSDELVVVLDDGTVKTAKNDWTVWADLDLGIELPLQTLVRPVSLGRLPDGRMIVHAALYDGRPGAALDAPSPFSAAGYFIADAP